MRFSYGTEVSVLFDSDNHEQHRKCTSRVNGEIRCSGVFEEIIKQNESVALGTKVSLHFSIPRQTATVHVNVYASNKEKPKYVDEDGCVLIGTAEIEISFPSEEERDVLIEYILGNTEISMTATEELYGTKVEATFKLI